MLYVRDFSDDEREVLTKNGKKRSFLGAKCRTLLGAGQNHLCAAQAARQFNHDPRVVRRWFHAFNTYGVASLWDQRFHPGNRKFTDEQIKALVELAHRRPDELDLPFSSWTYQALAEEAGRQRIVSSISATHYRRLLKAHDLTWKRNKQWIPIEDPNYEQKKHLRDATLTLVDLEECVVLSQDECGPLHKDNASRPGASITPKGKPEKRPSAWQEPDPSEKKERLEVTAAQNVQTREVHYVVRPHKTQEDLIDLLLVLLTVYADKLIFLLMDNSGMHKGHKLQAFLAEHPYLFIIWLPTHAPWLNPIERTFLIFKKRCLASRNFSSLEELEKTIHAFWAYYNATYATRASTSEAENTAWRKCA